jgi:hypothetical protein
MPDNEPFPIIRVEAIELRRIFNDQNIHGQTKTGVLRQVIMKEKHPSPQPASEPYCTRSQMVAYMNSEGMEVARVHQYLRPDGTIGGSGKPDPKRLLFNGAIYLPG